MASHASTAAAFRLARAPRALAARHPPAAPFRRPTARAVAWSSPRSPRRPCLGPTAPAARRTPRSSPRRRWCPRRARRDRHRRDVLGRRSTSSPRTASWASPFRDQGRARGEACVDASGDDDAVAVAAGAALGRALRPPRRAERRRRRRRRRSSAAVEGTFVALGRRRLHVKTSTSSPDPPSRSKIAPYGPGEGARASCTYQTKRAQPFWEALTREGWRGRSTACQAQRRQRAQHRRGVFQIATFAVRRPR